MSPGKGMVVEPAFHDLGFGAGLPPLYIPPGRAYSIQTDGIQLAERRSEQVIHIPSFSGSQCWWRKIPLELRRKIYQYGLASGFLVCQPTFDEYPRYAVGRGLSVLGLLWVDRHTRHEFLEECRVLARSGPLLLLLHGLPEIRFLRPELSEWLGRRPTVDVNCHFDGACGRLEPLFLNEDFIKEVSEFATYLAPPGTSTLLRVTINLVDRTLIHPMSMPDRPRTGLAGPRLEALVHAHMAREAAGRGQAAGAPASTMRSKIRIRILKHEELRTLRYSPHHIPKPPHRYTDSWPRFARVWPVEMDTRVTCSGAVVVRHGTDYFLPWPLSSVLDDVPEARRTVDALSLREHAYRDIEESEEAMLETVFPPPRGDHALRFDHDLNVTGVMDFEGEKWAEAQARRDKAAEVTPAVGKGRGGRGSARQKHGGAAERQGQSSLGFMGKLKAALTSRNAGEARRYERIKED
ncbi:Hypothetical protein D9617_14g076310 [Elsinoe fawcettii]|nr:Hypothetical protein D9617_14g076310 [Elsinoe fawcettii]